MKNFQLIHQGLSTVGLLLSLKTKPHLWDQNTLRTATEGTPHKEVNDIWLRMNDLSKCIQSDPENKFVDHRESINYPAMAELPQARNMIMSLMTTVGGERLGRCFISKMKPGTSIGRHSDIGDDLSVHYDNEQYYHRYHIVLQGGAGSMFMCGEEQVNMRTGEVWWFDGSEEHEVVNNSTDDRIHIVCDIKVSL